MMTDFLVELVIRQAFPAAQEPEGARLDNCVPVSGLGADGTIAFVSSLREINVDFESNRAAMTTACIGFDHRQVL